MRKDGIVNHLITTIAQLEVAPPLALNKMNQMVYFTEKLKS